MSLKSRGIKDELRTNSELDKLLQIDSKKLWIR